MTAEAGTVEKKDFKHVAKVKEVESGEKKTAPIVRAAAVAALDDVTAPELKEPTRIRSMIQLLPEADEHVEKKLEQAIENWKKLPRAERGRYPSKARIIERIILKDKKSEG